MASRILFVGKNDSRLETTWARLECKGYAVTSARSRKPALAALDANPPQIVIADLTVPRTGADRLCRRLSRHYPHIPILLLVDDEQPPPKFPFDRTLTRAASSRKFSTAIQKMLAEEREHILTVGSLSLDLSTRVTTGLNSTASLCPKEALLLATLMRHPSTVLKHRFLMKEVWETDFVDDLGTLWTHVSSLRAKIEPHKDRRLYLHTVRGLGYRLDVWPPPAPK